MKIYTAKPGTSLEDLRVADRQLVDEWIDDERPVEGDLIRVKFDDGDEFLVKVAFDVLREFSCGYQCCGYEGMDYCLEENDKGELQKFNEDGSLIGPV